jgi:hypothetical protein
LRTKLVTLLRFNCFTFYEAICKDTFLPEEPETEHRSLFCFQPVIHHIFTGFIGPAGAISPGFVRDERTGYPKTGF